TQDVACGSLCVQVPEQGLTGRKCRARPGEIHGQSGFPDPALAVVNGYDHLACSENDSGASLAARLLCAWKGREMTEREALAEGRKSDAITGSHEVTAAIIGCGFVRDDGLACLKAATRL